MALHLLLLHLCKHLLLLRLLPDHHLQQVRCQLL
jgi:hypothetical protein